jgi:hypothetical protein
LIENSGENRYLLGAGNRVLTVEDIGGNSGYSQNRGMPLGRHDAILTTSQDECVAGFCLDEPSLAAQSHQFIGIPDVATLFEVGAHDAVQNLPLQAAPGGMRNQQV